MLIPISQPDKMSSIGPRNLMGHIIEAQDSVYTVSTSHGTIFTGYARNQFDVCPFKISAYELILLLLSVKLKQCKVPL